MQNPPKHGAVFKGRGARAPRKRNRPRVLRGLLSQVVSLPRPKTKAAYLGGRMTELKHRKRACVMAYLILANEEARVRRTHGALENSATSVLTSVFCSMVNNEQRCERLGFYFLIYFLTRLRRRFWQRIFGIVIIRPQQKVLPLRPMDT